MRHKTLAAFVVLAAATIPSPSAPAWAQSMGQTIDVQGWKVHLDKNADGSATCAAMYKFDDDSAVGFAADTKDNTFLIVSEPEAALVKDRRYPVAYSVDGGKSKQATGIATSKAMLVVPISDPDADFGAFGRGKALTVEFGGDSYEEPLEKVRPAIQALGRCIAAAPR